MLHTGRLVPQNDFRESTMKLSRRKILHLTAGAFAALRAVSQTARAQG